MKNYHYHLNASLTLVNIINNIKCIYNEVEEDMDHVVCQCKFYNPKTEIKLQLPANIETIIAKPSYLFKEMQFKFRHMNLPEICAHKMVNVT